MKMIAALLTLALNGVWCAAQTVSLEQSASDVKATLAQVKSDAKAQGAAANFRAAQVTGIDVRQDCKEFVFTENSPALSASQDFRSETWIEECDNIPLPNPPGGGMCIPRRRLLSVDQRTVQVNIVGRQAPGPKEVFDVCLWGSSLHLSVIQSPNKYKVQETSEPVFKSTLNLTKK